VEILCIGQVGKSDKRIGRRNLAVWGVGIRGSFEIKSANKWLDAQYGCDDGAAGHEGFKIGDIDLPLNFVEIN